MMYLLLVMVIATTVALTVGCYKMKEHYKAGDNVWEIISNGIFELLFALAMIFACVAIWYV